MANRIFIILSETYYGPGKGANALAADGTGLAFEARDNKLWLREAMGLTFKSSPMHKKYAAHFPAGYELVDLLDASDYDLEHYPGFVEAWNLNHAED